MVKVAGNHIPVVDAEPSSVASTAPGLIHSSADAGLDPSALHRLKPGAHNLYDEVNDIFNELSPTEGRGLIYAEFNEQQGGFSLRRDGDGEIWIRAQGRDAISIMDVLYSRGVSITPGQQEITGEHALHATLAEHAFKQRELFDLVRATITFRSANGERTLVPDMTISQDAYSSKAPLNVQFLDTGPIVDLSEPGLEIDSIQIERLKVLNLGSGAEETALQYQTYQRPVSPAENPVRYSNMVVNITEEPLDDPGNRRGLQERKINGFNEQGKLEIRKFNSQDKPTTLSLEYFKVVQVTLADVHDKIPPLLGSRQEAGKLYQEKGSRDSPLAHQVPSERQKFLEQHYYQGLPLEVNFERELHRRVPGSRRGEIQIDKELRTVNGTFEGTVTTEQRPNDTNMVLITATGTRVLIPIDSLVRVIPRPMPEENKVLWTEEH